MDLLVTIFEKKEDAVNEAVDKVLARPIRPQFVIASIGPFTLQQAQQLITGRFGSKNNYSSISRNIWPAMQLWECIEDDDETHANLGNENRGVLLTVGFLPGLKDQETDMKPVLQELDYAFCRETVIVGEKGSQFLYQGETSVKLSNNEEYSSAAVTLFFLRDRRKPPGTHCFSAETLQLSFKL
ncbi:F-box/LRR-repeat protein At5g63520-like [Nicotiana tomentosiformis]|uniref:F-box/LRR-repeat protein At5g63520-like n=1 Tax=Nicotiana tomentosiformis TaxID=4098 RepID=UPI00388C3CFD